MARVSKAPQVRRQEIIETALSLFGEKGYEQTSMQDISQRMQVSQGLCYRYFQSKEEIYAAALERYVEEGVAAFQAQFAHSDRSLKEKLAALQPLESLRPAGEEADFFNLPGNRRFHMQMHTELLRRLYPWVVGVLQEAQAKQEVALESPEAVAAFCLYGQLGVWLHLDQDPSAKMLQTQKLICKLLD